jgi:hypothetical protein
MSPHVSTTIYPNGDFTLGFSKPRFINTSKSSQANRSKPVSITSYGRKMLRNGCFALEEGIDNQRRTVGFYTATIPALSPEEIFNIGSDWSEIVRKFFQELRRVFERNNETFYFAYCTEIQLKRSRALGVNVLHLHWVAPTYKLGTKEFIVSSSTLRKIWSRMLAPYINSEVSFNASIDSQVLKKSAQRYLSKYISKSNSKCNDDGIDSQYTFQISAFWGMSKELRRWIKDRCVKDSADIAEVILEICKGKMTQFLNYLFPITVKSYTDNWEYIVGYAGNTNIKFYEEP